MAVAAANQQISIEQAIKAILQRGGTKKAYKSFRRYLKPGSMSTLMEVHVELLTAQPRL